MALRLYAIRDSHPTLSITKRGNWGNPGTVDPGILTLDKADESFNGVGLRTVGGDGVIGHGFEYYVGVYELTTDLYINGTVDVCFGSYGGSDYTFYQSHWALHIYVTVGASDSHRGTALDNYQDPNTTTNMLPPQTDPRANSLTAPQTLTAIQGFAGDFIVVELGWYQGAGNPFVAARALGSGCRNAGGTILPDFVPGDVFDTGSGSGAPWVEFALLPTPPPQPSICPPCQPSPGSTPDPIGTLPPWVQTCDGGGQVDSVADLADGEDWAA